MKALLRAALELLLPSVCAGCGRSVPTGPLCAACEPKSADALGAAPRALSAWCAAISYEGAGAEWVRRFKYPARGLRGLDPAAEAVAFGLVRRLARSVPGAAPDLVVPVPLHPRRVRERGFNQAALLAQELARRAGVASCPDVLVRRLDTAPQAGLSAAARRRNVREAFAVRSKAKVAGKTVTLVDDVVTTGATALGCGRELLAAGAREVRLLSMARVV